MGTPSPPIFDLLGTAGTSFIFAGKNGKNQRGRRVV
jgi:hypothetical protein